MFYIIVAVINSVGWLIYYFASGGFFEITETDEVRTTTIVMIIVSSVVSIVVAALLRNRDNRVISNILHCLVVTSLVTGMVTYVFYGQITIFERLLGVVLIGVVIIFYVASFVIPRTGYNPFIPRLLIFCLAACFFLFFTETRITEFGIGCGLMIGAIPSIINGIYNYFCYEE